MNRQPVVSSNVADVGYDPQSRTLEVGFHSGGVYQYYHVPPDKFRGLTSAPSVGSYLHQQIKGIYSYRKLR